MDGRLSSLYALFFTLKLPWKARATDTICQRRAKRRNGSAFQKHHGIRQLVGESCHGRQAVTDVTYQAHVGSDHPLRRHSWGRAAGSTLESEATVRSTLALR